MRPKHPPLLCLISIVVFAFQVPRLLSQTSLRGAIPLDASVSSSLLPDHADEGAGGQAEPSVRGHTLLDSVGVDVHVGVNGVGGDVALPLTQRFNLRLGGQYFKYTDYFTESGANVTAALQVGNGVTALDWFPFHTGFRISPQAVFAVQTRVLANVIVPAGEIITLNGQDFTSSTANPLQGSGSVDTRKVAPGISIGWGNISPRGSGRFSFPVEAGFYYIGQPNLRVSFSGTACDPQQPVPIGCQDVTRDPDFQKSLNAFILRNQHNLSYASFFPIVSAGVGYRF